MHILHDTKNVKLKILGTSHNKLQAFFFIHVWDEFDYVSIKKKHSYTICTRLEKKY